MKRTLGKYKHALAWAAGLSLGALPSPLAAAGFYLQEQSVSGLGRAFAGEAAVAADASTIYFNPAGMARLEAAELQVAVHLLVPRSTVRDAGSTAKTPAVGDSVPLAGGSGGNPYKPSPVPNLFYAAPVSERTWAGFGLTVPFGLTNGYDRGFFARYDSSKSALRIFDLQPSIAWRLSERISIGGGVNIQYADATLKNALPDPTAAGGPTVASDGEFGLAGDSWNYGFNAGVLVDLTETTRLGLHYRQGITHTLKGTAVTRLPPGLGGLSITEAGRADLKLPDIVSVGLSHRRSERWTWLAQFTWFNWSNFDEIAIRLSVSDDPKPVRQNYQNTWALALGAEYALDERWTLRGGIQYDRTPTRDGFRTTRTPDGDRTWFAAGASYEPGGRFGFDFAYTYINIAEEPIQLTREFYTGNPVTATTVNLTGTTRGHVQILAAAVRYRF